jgi:HlyD family secretion protein
MASRRWGFVLFLAGAVVGAAGYEHFYAFAQAGAQEPLPAVSAPPPTRPTRISALGRIEPKDGVIEVAGPSEPSVVIARLLVDEGDRVKRGQLLATLDTASLRKAQTERLEAELANAVRDLERTQRLKREAVISDSELDASQTLVQSLEAQLREARANLRRASVRSPVAGQVLEVHAREGERVGPEGILVLGRTDDMFAIAEIYETDVARVAVGQRATITSAALREPLTGVVEWINLQIGKQDALGTDPAARKDARVVEVEIRLDESRKAAALTNLQVEIEVEVGTAS